MTTRTSEYLFPAVGDSKAPSHEALRAILRDALALIADLGRIHDAGGLHGAITPAAVRRVDGAVVGLQPRRESKDQGDAWTVARLRYAAPEQAGRLEGSLTPRTDLYTVGILLYDWIVGEPPFVSDDPLELAHQQLAAVPKPPSARAREIPPVLSAIVMKLLSKAPANRYGSCGGLAHDLRACMTMLERRGAWTEFPLGMQDAAGQFRIPDKLYGRAAEIRKLEEFHHRAAEGDTVLCLVGGYSGIGKTALARSLRTSAVGGFMLEGKYDQFHRHVPYSAFGTVVASLLRRILALPGEEVEHWRARFESELGEDADVIAEVLPEVTRVIGPRPAPEPLSGAAAQHRFNHAFGRFFNLLAEPGLPLVLFLDDMQWADFASLALLQSLLSEQKVPNLLLLCAYRDNEIDESHPLIRMLAEVRKRGVVLGEIAVGPLSQGDLEELVHDTCPSLQGVPAFCRQIMRRTEGNPFYARQLIGELYASGHLRFSISDGRWVFDRSGFESAGMTENVIDLMVRRLRRLPPESLSAMHTAACVGERFRLATLAIVMDISEADALSALAPALHGEMLLPAGDPAVREFTFLHDRVQQAAYGLEPEDATRRLHLRVARLWLAHLSPAELNESLFDVAGHFNKALALLKEPTERLAVAQVNFRAGSKALAAMAYQAAADHFSSGIKLLPKDAWKDHFELAFDLHLQASDAMDRAGRIAEFEGVYAVLREKARTPLEKAAVCRRGISCLYHQSKLAEINELGREGLSHFGVLLPPLDQPDQLLAAFHEEVAEFRRLTKGKDIASLANLPISDDSAHEAVASLMSSIPETAIFINYPLFSLIAAIGVNRAIRDGLAQSSPISFVLLGIALISHFKAYEEARQVAAVGVALVHGRLSEPWGFSRCMSYQLWNVVHWVDRADTALPDYEEAYSNAVRAHDILYAAYMLVGQIWLLHFLGRDADELAKTVRRALVLCETNSQPFVASLIQPCGRVAAALQGRTSSLGELSGEGFEMSAFMERWKGVPIVLAGARIAEMQQKGLAGDYAAVLALSRGVPDAWPKTYLLNFSYWFWLGLAHLHMAGRGAAGHLSEYLKIEQYFASVVADGCAANVEGKMLFLQASHQRILGHAEESLALGSQAVASAQAEKFLLDAGFYLESLAQWRADAGDFAGSSEALRDAVSAYRRCRATALEERVLSRLPPEHKEAEAADFGLDPLDVVAVLRAAQAISSEVEIESLLRSLLRILLEAAGAERAWIVTLENGDLHVEGSDGAITPGDSLPEGLLRFVANTGEPVAMGASNGFGEFAEERCLQARNPQSLLCMPFSRRGGNRRVLYLEHGSLPGAFSQRRQQVLSWLAAQAAISLDNAALYAQAQSELAERKRSERREIQRRRVLEKVATGTPLPQILESIVQLVETESPDSICSILVVDKEGKRLLHGAGPSLPKFYNEAIHGLVFGDGVGSCGTAAATGKRVVVEDISTHPYWAAFTELAGKAGLASCWSEPIRAANGRVLGTFAIYHKVVRAPKEEDLRLIEYAAEAASLVIERSQADQELARHRHHLEELVADRTRELEAANRAKSAFLAAMSHEIRTPMNAILGYAQLLRRDRSLSSAHIGQVETINRAGEQLLGIINDILDMSKIEAGLTRRNDSAFDLHMELDGIVELHTARASAKSLTLVAECAPDVPCHIVTDQGKLSQILGNIIGNAVKFTTDGGIRVAADLAQIVGDEAELRFAVTDTGPGITPEELSKLFRPFVQSTAGIKAGGTGLGLSIAREYARLLGGDITVTSEAGRGSTFILTIRARIAESAEIVARTESPVALRLVEGASPVRILVVDDEAMNRQLLADMLGSVGFEVHLVEDGSRAVEAFTQWKPQAIIMDMRMPGMDGIEATRRIKAMPHGADTLIVALSASAFEEERVAFAESGADTFMSKPFRRGELLDYLGKHLGLRYVYEDAAVAPHPSSQVNPEALARITPSVRAAIIAACGQADCEKLAELCDALTDIDPETVAALRESIARFDYETLVALLSECESASEATV